MKALSWFSLLILVLVQPVSVARAAIISTFTGGDVGEGLDLDGTFLYAIQGGGAGAGPLADLTTHTIRGATFQVDYNQYAPGPVIAGVDPFGSLVRPTNNGINYGATSNDNELESVMNGYLVAASFAAGRNSYTLDVTAGQQYELQVLLSENFYGTGNPGGNGTTRQNSYYVYDGLFTTNNGTGSTILDSATDVNVINLLGASNVQTQGVVLTMLFTALSNKVTLAADIGSNPSLDNVSIINAVTVKAVPEPASFGMMAAGLIGLLAIRRRKK